MKKLNLLFIALAIASIAQAASAVWYPPGSEKAKEQQKQRISQNIIQRAKTNPRSLFRTQAMPRPVGIKFAAPKSQQTQASMPSDVAEANQRAQ